MFISPKHQFAFPPGLTSKMADRYVAQEAIPQGAIRDVSTFLRTYYAEEPNTRPAELFARHLKADYSKIIEDVKAMYRPDAVHDYESRLQKERLGREFLGMENTLQDAMGFIAKIEAADIRLKRSETTLNERRDFISLGIEMQEAIPPLLEEMQRLKAQYNIEVKGRRGPRAGY